MAIILLEIFADGTVNRIMLVENKTVVKPKRRAEYSVIDEGDSSGTPGDGITIKSLDESMHDQVVIRAHEDLIVQVDGEVRVEFDGFFREANPGEEDNPDEMTSYRILEADGDVVRLTAESSPIGMIGDNQLLYASEDRGGDGIGWLPLGLLGLGAAAGAVVLGGSLLGLEAAAGAAALGGGSKKDKPEPAGPAKLTAKLDSSSDTGAQGDGITNDTTPTLSGTGAPGATVKVAWPNGTSSSVPVGPDGKWSATPTTPLAAGTHDIPVTQTDSAGKVSPATPVKLTIDAAAPTVPVAKLDSSSDSGTPGDGITSDTTPTLSGTGDPGATIKVAWPNGTSSSVLVGADGKWSATPTTPLAAGTHTIPVTQTDPAGNVSPAAPVKLMIDAAAPLVPTAALDSSSDTDTLGDNITSDTTPTLSGTGELGATIKVAWPNGTSSSVPVGADGTWSATPTTPLAAGAHTIPVTQTDPAGNVSPVKSVPVTINAVAGPLAPTAALDSSSDSGTPGDGITSDTTPTLSGAGAPGATVKVAWPDGTSSSVPVGTNGKWSATPTTPLTPGGHDIPVTQTDPAGNVSPVTPVRVTIDAAAPLAPTAKLDPSSDTGRPGDGITSDTTPTLSGTGELGATIKVVWPDGTSSSVPVGTNGTWSATPTTPLAPGAHTIPVTQTDPAGNVSPATPVRVTVDTLVPVAPVAQIGPPSDTGTPNDGITNDPTPTLSGEGEPGTTVTVAWPDGTSSSVPVGADGTWSATPTTPLAAGAHTIPVTQTDPAGNVSPTTPVRVTIDAAAPLAPTAGLDPSSDSGTPGDNITSDTTPTLTGTGELGATIKVAWPDGTSSSVPVGTNGTWTATPTTPLTPGGHDIRVTQTDPAGNVSPATPVRVTIDAAAPLAPTAGLDPSSDTGTLGDNITSDTTPTLLGTGELGATIKVAWPDGTSSSVPVGPDGKWAATPTTPLALGAHTIPVTQTDPAGNVSPATPVRVTIDAAAPLAPTAGLDPSSDTGALGDNITSDTTPTLLGTGELGATIKVAWPDGTSSSVPVGADGTWSATPTTPLAPGAHTIPVTQADAAGNVSAPTPVKVTVDTAVPTQTVTIVSAQDNVGTPGNLLSGGITDDATPTLTGTLSAPLAVGERLLIEVILEDMIISLGEATVNGTDWTFTTPMSLPLLGEPLWNGTHRFRAVPVDQANHVGPRSSDFLLTIDTSAPAAPTAKLDPTSDTGTKDDGITSDTTPTLSGEGEPGATIKVAWPDGTSSSVPVGTNGTWTATPTTPLALGGHDIRVTQTDPAGNVSPATPVRVTINAMAGPVAKLDSSSDTGPKGDGITSDTTPTLSGEGQPGATIKVAWPDGTSSSVPVGTNGTWTATPTTPLAPGAHTIPVTQTDPAGNVSPATPVRVTIDAAAPLAPTAGLDPSSDRGTPGDGITSDTTPTLSGEGEPGATVKVAWPDGTSSSVPVGTNGTWTATPTTPLALGAHNIPVTQTDPAGNVSPATPVRVTIGAIEGPVAQLDSSSDTGPKGDGITSYTTPTLSGTGDPGATIKVAWPDGTSSSEPVGPNGTWTATPTTPLALGTHNIPVTQTDPAGNVSPVTPVRVTRVPNAPPVDGNETPSATEDTPFTPINLLANATDPNGDALTVTVDSITGNTAWAVSVTNGMLAVNTDEPDLDSLAAGQTQVVTVNYTVSDGKGGTDASTATVTINGVNDAPVLASTTATSSAALFAGEPITKLSYAPIEGRTGGTNVVPSGWVHSVQTTDLFVGSIPNFRVYNGRGAAVTLRDVDGTSISNGAGTDSAIMGLEGHPTDPSLSEESYTTLSSLTVGNKYAVAFQWQEAVLNLNGNNVLTGGGGVRAVIDTTVPTVLTRFEPLATGQDGWKTEVVYFTATATTHKFYLGARAESAGSNAYIVADSVNASQFTVPSSTNTGVAASAVFGGSSDVDSGATLKGYAVTSAAAAGTGHWQYSSDGGTTWIDLDTASVTGAILLAPTDLIHWTGAPGTNTALSARAVDNTSSAALHSAVDVTVNGGTTPYSANVSTLAANSTPVVLDLNQDGVISYTTARFDVDGNGVADSTAWVGGGDGILFWDKQGDGQLHGQDQYAFGKAVKGTDLEGLAALFDSNKDGMFDAFDTAFGQFKVWKDTDQNGQVGDGELVGLADAGITGIQLTSDRNAFDPAPGVHAFGKGSALLADGSTMLLHDAAFEYRPLG